jgi:hypothetical protein
LLTRLCISDSDGDRLISRFLEPKCETANHTVVHRDLKARFNGILRLNVFSALPALDRANFLDIITLVVTTCVKADIKGRIIYEGHWVVVVII